MSNLDINTESVHSAASFVDLIASELSSAMANLTIDDCGSGFLPESKAAHPHFVAELSEKNFSYTATLISLAESLHRAASAYETQDEGNAGSLDIPMMPASDSIKLNL